MEIRWNQLVATLFSVVLAEALGTQNDRSRLICLQWNQFLSDCLQGSMLTHSFIYTNTYVSIYKLTVS